MGILNFEIFKARFEASKEDIFREVYRNNRESIRIKREKTAVKNFEIIFDAVFKISYAKGFQAMSMRDLSAETGISMGALYGYFASKEALLHIIQQQGRSMVLRILAEYSAESTDPGEQLRSVIRAHLFLSELARPWFFFTFMEARNLNPEKLKEAQDMEAYTENILVEILMQGEEAGLFKKQNHLLTASLIKAMQQDWYLKRWKYKERDITVDAYADHLIGFVESFIYNPRDSVGAG